MRIATYLAAWMIAFLATGLPASGLEDAGAVVGQEQEAADSELYGWSGVVPDRRVAERQLADARVLMEADGDLDRAEDRLRAVWLQATAADTFEGQLELLVEVTLARVELYRRRGDLERALQASQEVLLRKEDLRRLQLRPTDVVLVQQGLRDLAQKALADARLVQLRGMLEEASRTSEDDALERMVREAYAAEDFAFIAQIGAPALPAFAREIVAHAGSFPAGLPNDPLYWLLRMNERYTARLLLANLNADGYLWKRRIVRAMTDFGVLNNDGTWSSEEPYVCLEPEWLSVLEALLSSPETALQSVPLIEEPFFRDQLTPGIQAAVVHGIENYGLDFVNQVLETLDQGGVVDSAQAIFEAAARHDDPRVRRFAARKLTNYEASPALLSMADDPDPEVRRSVAVSLGQRYGERVRRWNPGGVWQLGTYRVPLAPPQDETERSLLRQFSADPSTEVRSTIIAALVDLTPPLEDDVYRRLAGDSSPSVRSRMVRVASMGPGLRAEILTRLAKDESKEVLYSVDAMLSDAPLDSDVTPYLEAIRVRLSDHRYPVERSAEREVVRKLLSTPRGLQAVASWVLAREDQSFRVLFFEEVQRKGFDCLLRLDDATLGGVFAVAHETSTYAVQETKRVIREVRPSRRESMRVVLSAETYNTAVRLNAAELAAQDGGEVFRGALMQLLADDYWKQNPATRDELRLLERTVEVLPRGDRNQFALAVVRDAAIPVELAQVVAKSYSTSAPGAREVTLAILERWLARQDYSMEAVEKAIEHLAVLPADATPELLRTIALNPRYSRHAVRTIIALHREEDLPALARCMEAEWMVNLSERTRVRSDAARGVSSFLSDQAAEILLRGLASAEAKVRTICADGLDNLELTRTRQRRWEEHEKPRPTRESALDELLEMLDSQNQEIRVQAVRGIATFGAIEYLPTLIRLLDDPTPEVGEAARVAIDTLNRAASMQREAAESE